MVNDLLQQYPGEVLRYVILSAHYRSEQNFGKDLLDSAWRSLDTLYGFLQPGRDTAEAVDISDRCLCRLIDDLNTPMAISELHKLAREMNAAEGEECASQGPTSCCSSINGSITAGSGTVVYPLSRC